MTESVLLSMSGAVLRVVVPAAVIAVARRGLVDVVPRIEDVSMNVPVPAVRSGKLSGRRARYRVFGVTAVPD